MLFCVKSAYPRSVVTVLSFFLLQVSPVFAADQELEILGREWKAHACSALLYGPRNPLTIDETPNIDLSMRYGRALIRAGRSADAYNVLYGALQRTIPYGVPHALQNAFAEYRQAFGYPTLDQGVIGELSDIPEAHPTRTDGFWLSRISDALEFVRPENGEVILRVANTLSSADEETRSYSSSGETAISMADGSGQIVPADLTSPPSTIPENQWRSAWGRILLGNGQGIVRFRGRAAVRARVVSREGNDITEERYPDLVNLGFYYRRHLATDQSVAGLLEDRTRRLQARNTWDFSKIFDWKPSVEEGVDVDLDLIPAARGKFYLGTAAVAVGVSNLSEIWLLDSMGREIQNYSVYNPTFPSTYDVSPTGEHFAFGNQSQGYQVIDKSGRQVSTIPKGPLPADLNGVHAYSNISFSADGTKLVVRSFYFNEASAHEDVRVFSLDGTHLATPYERSGITTGEGTPARILHSPDGTYFIGTNSGTSENSKIWYWSYDGKLLMTKEGGEPLFLNTGDRTFILDREGQLRATGMAR